MKTFMRDKMDDVRPNIQKRCTFSMWLIIEAYCVVQEKA